MSIKEISITGKAPSKDPMEIIEALKLERARDKEDLWTLITDINLIQGEQDAIVQDCIDIVARECRLPPNHPALEEIRAKYL